MPIELGLSRIGKLLSCLGNPHVSGFKSIHVAGTNGKGSVVAYLSSILAASDIRVGRFTSPHMVQYNDVIAINESVYPLAKFEECIGLVEREDKRLGLGCTEFELLTATAFKIFEREKVDLAVIEVGLGGRLDSTNVLRPIGAERVENGGGGGVIVTAITKIGLDHQGFLGNTLGQIAGEKAGIIKQGVPCVVDKTNTDEVLRVIQDRACKETRSDLVLVDGLREPVGGFVPLTLSLSFAGGEAKKLAIQSPLLGEYQRQNLAVALGVIDIVALQPWDFLHNPDGLKRIDYNSVAQGIKNTKWPGRLQIINIRKYNYSILLDGAHNESAAIQLGEFLSKFYRTRQNQVNSNSNTQNNQGIIFVVGSTRGKAIDNLLKHITNKHTDTIIPATFSTPYKMPWITSYNQQEIYKAALPYVNDVKQCQNGSDIANILKFLDTLKSQGDERNIVVCGSLYLCGELLRYVDTLKVKE